jgi:hypothetical protein
MILKSRAAWRSPPRSGIALILMVAAIVFAGTVTASLVQGVLLQGRAANQAWLHLQAELCAQSAWQRTLRQLQSEPELQPETWTQSVPHADWQAESTATITAGTTADRRQIRIQTTLTAGAGTVVRHEIIGQVQLGTPSAQR